MGALYTEVVWRLLRSGYKVQTGRAVELFEDSG
jgi:hypothetical protein